MKIRTVRRGKITMYELWTDNRQKEVAASTQFIDYVNGRGPGAVEASPLPLRRLCRYRTRKLLEERNV